MNSSSMTIMIGIARVLRWAGDSVMSSDMISHNTTKRIDELIEKLKSDTPLSGGERLDIAMHLEPIQFYRRELKNVLDGGKTHETI